MASFLWEPQSRDCRADDSRKVQVTILASEWGSSKGGLSTINRELAIQLAKCSEVEITFFLPQCSQEDKKAAMKHNVKIIEATPLPGFEQLDWLCFPPEDLQIDIIICHGVKLGKQAQIIKRPKRCKWVQVVHTDPEELGMFKNYSDPISKGEEKHKMEVKLCEMADHVVGVGPKLSEAFRSYLRSCQKDDNVVDFTPGVFVEFVSVKQASSERQQRSVLVFGRGDVEDFKLKGFDIAGKAVAELEDTRLVFVGAPDGKHEEIAKRLTECGVPASRLRVRGFVQDRESLRRLFQEVDLVVMPSRTEGFGLAGLEALSAGLPVLVSRNSGFGKALHSVPFGSTYVVNSEEPADWTSAIKTIFVKDRRSRLEEAETLRESYGKKYNWAKQIKDLIDMMISWVYDDSLDYQSSSETKRRIFPSTDKASQQMEGTTVDPEGLQPQELITHYDENLTTLPSTAPFSLEPPSKPQQQEYDDNPTKKQPSTASSSNASLDSSFNCTQTNEETLVAPFIERMKKHVRDVTEKPYGDLKSPFHNPGEGPRRDLKLDEIFTNLIVYEGRAKYDFSGDRVEQLNEYHKGNEKLPPVLPGDIFDAKGQKILVVGRPGIGKTMFSTKILRKWGCDNLLNGSQKLQMDFVGAFLIKLRMINSTNKELNLRELLDHSEYSTSFSEDYWNYVCRNPEQVLVIFDGFDEYSGRTEIINDDVQYRNNEEERMPVHFLLKKIVSGKILTGATVLMTTTPNAVRFSTSLDFDKTVEILGFSTAQVNDYVQKFTKEEDKAETIKQCITSNLNLVAFCYVPANCFIICSCLLELLGNTSFTILPTRLTEIYSIAVRMFYFSYDDDQYRHNKTEGQQFFLKPFKELPSSVQNVFTRLGKIAFDGIRKGRRIFESHEVNDLEVNVLFHRLPDFRDRPSAEGRAQYCFLHLTVQEFLAAKYLVDMLSSEDLRDFVADHIRDGAWKVVMQFVAGLLAEEEGQSTDIFSDLLPSKTVTIDVDSVMSEGREERTERVPLDIQARGPLATEVYNRELKEGQGYARRVPIMIIGQARTGKTSLKKSLKGELFDPKEGSTEGIETDPSYFKVTTDVWRTGSNSEDTETEPEFLLDRQLAQNIFKGLKEKDPSRSGTKPSVKDFKVVEPSEANSPPTKRSEEYSSNRFEPSPQDSKVVENAKAPSLRTEFSVEPEEIKTSSSVTEHSESDPSPQDSKDHQKVPENVAAWVEKLLKENKEFMEGDDMYSVIWDFGGQSVFYDTHPIFLTEKAIYILACDLSCDPYQKADAPVKQGMYEDIEDTDCQKTNFDYLDFWMSSIYSLVSNNTNRQEASSSETFPAVFLACTHADKPYTKKGNPSRKIFGALRKIYGSLLKDVFLVDNTKSGSNNECEGVKGLREKVRSVAEKLPQMEQEIPLKWLRYEKVLYLMRKEGLEKISIEDARKIASDKCGIDGEENFRTALNFLHDQKVLINFDESPGLERMVILNPQWLVDVFKEVITFEGFNHNDVNVEGLWREFEKSGILKRELLDHVWKRFIDDQNTCESLIEMMEKFSLLCQWPSEENTERYLVPSMLKSKSTSKFPNPGVETPSLFVKFKSRRVPPGGVPQGREPPGRVPPGGVPQGRELPGGVPPGGVSPGGVPPGGVPQGRDPPGRVPPGLFSRLIVLFHHWVQDQVKIKHKNRNQPKPCSNYAMFRIVPEDDISATLLCYSSLIEIVFVLEGDFLDERRLNISHGIHQQLGLILEGMRKEFSWLKHMDYELCVACSVCCGKKSPSSCGPHENRGCDCLHLFSEEELKDPFCDRDDDGASCRVAKEKFHLWFSSQEELEEFLRSFGGSTIHDEIINDVNAMDLLSRGLDKRIRLGEQELQSNLSYWKHLAEHFNVPREDMMMWQHPHERSPSRRMFELLDSEDPGFSVEKLKQKLKIIKRNDLVEKLKGTATLQDLFENKIYKSICVQLDYNGSWQTLGLELGISREERESIAIDSSTSYFQTVLEIVRTREPYLTVKEMRDFFEKEKRRDVCNVLPEGGTIQTLLEDIERLESLSVLLDKESPVLKNWRHFARKFGVSLDECNNLKPEALSPTKTLMEHIVQVEPKLTVKTLIEALKKIGRRDVVLALTKFFLGRSRTKQDANEKSISADEEVPKSP